MEYGSPACLLVKSLVHSWAQSTSQARGARIAFAFIPLLFSLLPKRKEFGSAGGKVGKCSRKPEKISKKITERKNTTGYIFPTKRVNEILFLLTQLYSVCFTLFGM